MATYFCDSSAVIKCYVTEMGSRWMNLLTDPTAGHLLTISRITTVEVPAGLARRKREASISDILFRDGLKAFRRACQLQYQLIEVDATISDIAQELIVRLPLRAYDAVQLASATIANRTLVAARLGPFVFLSAD